MNLKNHLPFWISTLSLAIFLLAPFYVQDGMFTDGIIYAAVSKNLAEGLGDWWQPVFTNIFTKTFYEQPPFAFWLQSFFFKILGNSFFTERVYCAITYLFACFSLAYFWKKINPTQQYFGWLPILLYTFTPLIFWSYRHNMLENTMLIFDFWAVVFFYKTTKNNIFFQKQNILNLIMGSFCVFLSVLTKGLVGLFPLAFFGLYYLVYLKNFQNLVFKGLTSGLFLISFFLLLFYFSPNALHFFTQYIDIQLLRSLKGEREAYDSGGQFLLLERLTQELIPILLAAFSTATLSYLCAKKIFFQAKKEILLFMLLGLSASLPMLVSPKQHGYYLVPCFIYFSLAASLFILPYLAEIERYFFDKKNKYIIQILYVFSFILLIFSILYTIKNKDTYSRDELILQDIHILEKNFPAFTSFGLSADYCSEYFIGAYLQRYGNFDTDCDNQKTTLFLSRSNQNLENNNYIKEENLGLKYFILWRKK